MKYFISIVALVLFAAVVGVAYRVNKKNEAQQLQPESVTVPAVASEPPAPPPAQTLPLSPPLDRSGERVTKKMFGTFVTPQNSPVQPERFRGYHTGVDFETFPEEKDADVPVHAVCAGPLLQKRTATGYGGIAVQACTVNGEAVTIVYGHLRLSSVTAAVNKDLTVGQVIGVLGTGYSSETDGERKHLHLGIHKGKTINILGYVQNKGDLSSWLDAAALGAVEKN